MTAGSVTVWRPGGARHIEDVFVFTSSMCLGVGCVALIAGVGLLSDEVAWNVKRPQKLPSLNILLCFWSSSPLAFYKSFSNFRNMESGAHLRTCRYAPHITCVTRAASGYKATHQISARCIHRFRYAEMGCARAYAQMYPTLDLYKTQLRCL